jgi:hypothetical protein
VYICKSFVYSVNCKMNGFACFFFVENYLNEQYYETIFIRPSRDGAILCDWVWRAGVHTGFCTITLDGVIRSKVKVTVTINIIFDNRVVSAR